MTDDKIKNYFLGMLDQEDTNHLEIEVAEDENLFEQAGIVEEELIDDYLQGSLSSMDKSLFESKYLITEARFEKVQFANIFLSSLKTTAKPVDATTESISIWNSVFAYFRVNRLIAIASLVVLLSGGIFLLFQTAKKNPEVVGTSETDQMPTPISGKKSETENSNISKELLPPPSDNKQNESNRKSPMPTANPTVNQSPQIETPPRKQTDQIKPTMASFTLFPGNFRSGGEQSIKIKPDTASIQLALSLPKESAKYQSYSASIKTADGGTIFTSNNLRSLNLKISSNILNKETYIIFLEGNNPQKPAESIAEYTFRVNR